MSVLLALLLLPAPLSAEGPSPAEVRQELLPALHAREEAAAARLADARSWLRGEGRLADALPELAAAPLDSRTWIKGRLAALDEAARERALEALDGELPALAEARREAHGAEEAAAELERSVLLAVDAVLLRYPVLGGLGALEAALEARVHAEPDPDDEAAFAAAHRAGQALAAIARLRAAALELAARHGTAHHGTAHHGTAHHGTAHHGTAHHGTAHHGTAPHGTAHHGTARPGAPADDNDLALLADPTLRALLADPTLRPLLAPGEPAGDPAARLAVIDEALTAPPIAGDGAIARIAAALEALERARLQEEGRALALAIQRSADATREEELEVAKERAAVAREQAERAQAEATDARARLRAQALALIAEEDTAAAGRLAALEREALADADALAAFSEELETLRAEVQEALKRGRLDPERAPALDGAYRRLRGLIGELRQAASDATEATARLTQRRADLAEHRDARLSTLATLSEDDELWRQMEEALGSRAAALAEATATREEHRAAVLHLLLEARELRRDLKPEISPELLAEDRSRLFEDLSEELRLLGPELQALGASRVRGLRELPRRLLDPGWLRDVLVGSVGLLVLLVAWGWLRPRTHLGVEAVVARIGERLPPWRRRELQRIPAAANPVAQAAVDLVAGMLLVGPTSEAFPELGLVLLVYLQVALVRLLFGLFELLVVREEDARAGVLRLPGATWSQARRTVRVLVLWGVVRQFLAYLSLHLLEADALHSLVTGLADLLLVGLVAWLLHLWEPAVRAEMARRADGGLVAALAQPPSVAFTRIPRAALGALLLLFSGIWRLLDLSASSRSPLGRLVNWIARRRLAPGAETEPIAPPEGLLDALLRDDPSCLHLERESTTAIDERFAAVFAAWREEHRPGLVLLAGDRGSGRGTWVERQLARIDGAGLPVLRSVPSERLEREEDALAWVARLLDLPPPEGFDQLVATIEALPRRVIVLEHLERAFLRRVGGFDGLRVLFSLAQLCSEEHFWILGLHQPAWRYLSRLHAVLDTRIFSDVLEIPAFDEGELRRLVEGRTRRAGHELSYASMERAGVLSEGDARAEEERTARTYFRLLVESSGGNPAIALRMWAECLAPGPDGRLHVRLSERLVRELPGELSDNELFVLVALRVQDRMTVEELAQVTNLPGPAVRAIVRRLLDRGLLREREERFAIPYRKLPAVTRVLTRRHFLHWAA